MGLKTTGRRSGRQRTVIIGYFEDGPNLVTLAMNGWASTEPSWWLNLKTRPEANVFLRTGPHTVEAYPPEETSASVYGRRSATTQAGVTTLMPSPTKVHQHHRGRLRAWHYEQPRRTERIINAGRVPPDAQRRNRPNQQRDIW